MAAAHNLPSRLGGHAQEGPLPVGSVQTTGGTTRCETGGDGRGPHYDHHRLHLLNTGRSYHELGGSYLEKINKDQLPQYFVKRLQRLRVTVTVESAA